MKNCFSFLLLCFILTASAQNPTHMGDKMGGGIVFYVDETGQHGLIAAPADQANDAHWGCMHKRVEASSLNDGAVNSRKIATVCGPKNAAAICLSLNAGGFNDWYLPAIEELDLLYKARLKIDGLTTNDYVSSSEYTNGNNDCWGIHFGKNGKHFYYNKHSEYSVRAIRKF